MRIKTGMVVGAMALTLTTTAWAQEAAPAGTLGACSALTTDRTSPTTPTAVPLMAIFYACDTAPTAPTPSAPPLPTPDPTPTVPGLLPPGVSLGGLSGMIAKLSPTTLPALDIFQGGGQGCWRAATMEDILAAFGDTRVP